MTKRILGPAAYSDVIPLLELIVARQKPRVTFTCESPAAAVHTIHRMNAWRSRCRERDPGGNSVWDIFIFRRDGPFIHADMRPPLACIAARDEDGEIPLADIRPDVGRQIDILRDMNQLIGDGDDSV